jgi:uncharacterized protein YdaU (DUF1376 family)
MPKPVWFPFYPNDFLASSKVTVMTTEEVGCYLFLLCHAWQDPLCSLPSDDATLQRLARFTGDMARVKACFAKKGGRLVNERLYKEWIKVKEKSELARHSVDIRWKNERNTNVIRTQYSSHRNIGTSESSQKNIGTEEPSESQSESEKERKSSRALKTSARASVSGETWESYRSAYKSRYGVDPVRNRTVNSILCRVVEKLGATEAPKVAAFYLTHHGAFYVQKMHPVNLLLADAEKLRTEWATNTKMTNGAVRNAEFQDNVVEQVKRVEALMKGRTV